MNVLAVLSPGVLSTALKIAALYNKYYGTLSLKRACIIHDRQYSIKGFSKDEADLNLYKTIIADNPGKIGKEFAELYYMMVKEYGESAYIEAQE